MERYAEVCGDNRFELIEKYKEKLVKATNIETSKEEMDVIDNILFRFWQMGWLDKLEEDVVPRSKYDAVVSAVDNSTKEFLKLHDAYQNQKRKLEEYDKFNVVPLSEANERISLAKQKVINIIADVLWQGESEKLNINVGEVYCNKQEFVNKIKKYIGGSQK